MASMKRRSPARRRPTGETAPRLDAVQSDNAARTDGVFTWPDCRGHQARAGSDTPAPTGGGFTALLERATQEILAVTYWFDPAPRPEPYPVTVRFSGRRVDVTGRLHRRDRFVQDETIAAVVPGSGPISITAKVHDVHPGEWSVTARILDPTHSAHSAHRANGLQQESARAVAEVFRPDTWVWRRWAPSAGSSEKATAPVSTCLVAFARVPGILPFIWAAMVALGMAAALALQSLVIARDHLAVGRAWLVTLVAIGVGIGGAKVWHIVLHRREHGMDRWGGWCIQGFITGATLAAAILLVVFRMPAGIVLDASAPGLLIAMAVGRVGCFFAGCCGGPPTASRWGVWSSDQRVGARRIPTQLLESALALSLGLGALGAVLVHGPAGGTMFAAALAAYTLGRQGILRLRAEPRQTRQGGPITATVSVLVLVVAVVVFALLAR